MFRKNYIFVNKMMNSVINVGYNPEWRKKAHKVASKCKIIQPINTLKVRDAYKELSEYLPGRLDIDCRSVIYSEGQVEVSADENHGCQSRTRPIVIEMLK